MDSNELKTRLKQHKMKIMILFLLLLTGCKSLERRIAEARVKCSEQMRVLSGLSDYDSKDGSRSDYHAGFLEGMRLGYLEGCTDNEVERMEWENQ